MNTLRLGVLFATQGAFGAPGRDACKGAALALQNLNQDGDVPFDVELVWAAPAGNSDSYVAEARKLLEQGCRHIFGTVTSQARKDVIPVIEKYDAQLWYVCPYEGFEANENVIYTGACPNQHLQPLMNILMPNYGQRVYLAGANYIWGWEMNRLAREIVSGSGGQILGERCLPIEETDVRRMVAEVERARPDFILNNLIGPSSHAFLRAMRQLASRDMHFLPQHCPIVSCDLTECELEEIGVGVADGHLSAASYFDSVTTAENLAFKKRVLPETPMSSFLATTYASVRMCVEAAARMSSDEPAQIRKALHAAPHDTLLGTLRIDERTNHASLPFHLGQIEGDGFTILKSTPHVAADPYLTHARVVRPSSHQPNIRLVS